MLVLKDKLTNTPIMSLHTGGELARTSEPIIDPRNLRIPAFYCEGPRLDIKPAVLKVDDIREVSSIGFIIDSVDELVSPNDLVRLQDIFNYHFTLVGTPVFDEDGRKLGKVMDYSVDPSSFTIFKLHVKPTFFNALGSTQHLIDRTQIKEIGNERIVVASGRIKKAEPVREIKKVVENPFRRDPVPES